MAIDFPDLSRRLAARALDVCAHYLSNGKRYGHYWLVGDVHNTPGRSLRIRLTGHLYGKGAAGKWVDAATAEHGDLIDLILLNRQLSSNIAAAEEAMAFLAMPPANPPTSQYHQRNSPDAARRLFNAARPIVGTLAETYLRSRSISCPLDIEALRFHPACYYRTEPNLPRQSRPALLSAFKDEAGRITGLLRTYLRADGLGKAHIPEPRLAMGHLLGNAIPIGNHGSAMAVGEGLETMLAIRSLMPSMPVLATSSAAHLAALKINQSLKKLYIAVDDDPAGHAAAEAVIARLIDTGIEIQILRPLIDDWNTTLMQYGYEHSLAHLQKQLT